MHELQVLGEDEQQAEQREEGDGEDDAREAEGADREHPDVDHRVRRAQLPPAERGQQQDGRTGLGQRAGRQPAALGAPDDHVDERGQAARGEQQAGHVQAAHPSAGERREQCQDGYQGGADQRDVDPEDAAPGEVFEQQTARDRADHDAEPGGRRPDRDRLRALTLTEQRHDAGQGGGHHEGRAQPHQSAQPDQLTRRGGGRGDGRACGEDREPADQGPALAHPGAEAAGGDQHRGEHQGVGVVDPLQIGGGGPQRRGEGGQRGVEHRVVDGDGHQRRAERREGGPASGMALVRARSAPGAAGLSSHGVSSPL